MLEFYLKAPAEGSAVIHYAKCGRSLKALPSDRGSLIR
jgi:hypothetical protein